MRHAFPVHLLLLITALLLPGFPAAHAQQPRAGVYIGNHSSTLQYEFLGEMQREDGFGSLLLGIAVEQPITDGLLLHIGGHLTRYSGGEIMSVHLESPSGTRYISGFFNERMMLEMPITAKYLILPGVLRPYVTAGAVLGVAMPVEHIWIDEYVSNSTPVYEDQSFALFHLGATAGAGLEIAPRPSFMLTAGLTVTQLLKASVDTPAVRVRNTPHVQVTFGVLFSLSAEDWQ